MNSMECKYGYFTNDQMNEYKKRLHSLVHWLLIYQENNNPNTEKYFQKVQYKLNGLNELLMYPSQLVEIQALVEAALIEYKKKEECDHSTFRKCILDAHEMIDRIPVGD